jgi:hypothetical protein
VLSNDWQQIKQHERHEKLVLAPVPAIVVGSVVGADTQVVDRGSGNEEDILIQ